MRNNCPQNTYYFKVYVIHPKQYSKFCISKQRKGVWSQARRRRHTPSSLFTASSCNTWAEYLKQLSESWLWKVNDHSRLKGGEESKTQSSTQPVTNFPMFSSKISQPGIEVAPLLNMSKHQNTERVGKSINTPSSSLGSRKSDS